MQRHVAADPEEEEVVSGRPGRPDTATQAEAPDKAPGQPPENAAAEAPRAEEAEDNFEEGDEEASEEEPDAQEEPGEATQRPAAAGKPQRKKKAKAQPKAGTKEDPKRHAAPKTRIQVGGIALRV
eukprot:TRINITY_DN3115_c2_g1_i3.p2 TRINITY_DN3115_c2_g1~~TRINITY_DN3115_c2_g1_i3.p2  ORF type:complete len:125 (-),score=55.45 TRINITY_DN3115_c2_g1_i3:189-563(-)